jgi:hypothetical protein
LSSAYMLGIIAKSFSARIANFDILYRLPSTNGAPRFDG